MSADAIETAVVMEVRQEVQLNHNNDVDKYSAWIPADHLVPAAILAKGERVIYNNWIGIVESVMQLGFIISTCGVIRCSIDPFGVTYVGAPYQASL